MANYIYYLMDKNSERKIICFVCSQELPGLEEWRNHITDIHEEKVEYLLCQECSIPCRDIISHYKVHHRNLDIPTMDIYRVEKMKDWDEPYRKGLRKKRKFKEGMFDSLKMGKKIHYRSSWERDAMICLEKCVDVNEYFGDDFICIDYVIQSKPRKYWPDFTIKLQGGDTVVVEIKPKNQAEWIINKAKWKYAVEYCNKRGWEFQVWTQKHICKIKTRAIRNNVLLREHIIPTKEEVIQEIIIQ